MAYGAVYAYLNVPAGAATARTETAQLAPSANDYETASSNFGVSIASSSDGRIVAVGAPYFGNVYIFTRSGTATTWTKTAKIFEPTGSQPDFGTTVALSGNGTRLLVGAPGNGGCCGKGNIAYYTYSSGSWTLQTQLASTVTSARFGATLAISNDGNTAAVGSSNISNSFPPRVDMYTLGTSTLTAKASVTDPSGKSGSGYAANSISLNTTGTVLAVGAPGVTAIGSTTNYTGVVYAYATSNTSSYQTLTRIGNTTDKLGTATSVSPDGLKVIAGAPGATNGAGGTFLFTRTSLTGTFSSPTPVSTFLTSYSAAGSSAAFGTNSRLIVGVPGLTYSNAPTAAGEAEVVDLS